LRGRENGASMRVRRARKGNKISLLASLIKFKRNEKKEGCREGERIGAMRKAV